MEIGSKVWIRDTTGDRAWISGTIVEKKSDVAPTSFVLSVEAHESGNIVKIRARSDNIENDEIKLRNDEHDEDVADLINLTHLHEPAMLHCLQCRYFQSQIYTYTGPILIAVNPFKSVQHLYTTAMLEKYFNNGLLRGQGIDVVALAPHVYAIADSAFRNMMKIVHDGYSIEKDKHKHSQHVNADQSILISGESGAGKTESTKIVLKYLTSVGNGTSNDDGQGTVMEKILQSNPILEAFGNSRTLRNDNSSRFGKFIELNFSRRGALVGGSIRTYLLEKVRLPYQQRGERNFHIFYQLFSGASQEDRNHWHLTDPVDFNYTSRGGVFNLQHVNDAKDYELLRTALCTLNFDEGMQQNLFDVVVGILHLGQIRFTSFNDGEGEGSHVSLDDHTVQSCELVGKFLGLAKSDLFQTLCTREIIVNGEIFTKKLSALQAQDARDAVAKVVYAKLFDWIVATVNMRIQVANSATVRANIGVLDIFGFESFASNSFEQLCINYTNESLQQQFNQYVFKMEQREYEKEKIEWNFVEFPDNKDCLDLIEHKLHGIFAMLDDECRLPKASDEKLAGRMYKAYEANSRFSASIVQRRDFKFSIHHYAGSVEYTTSTFVEKNKDELPKEASTLLLSASNPLLNQIFAVPVQRNIDNTSQSGKGSQRGGPKVATAIAASVGYQFKDQLSQLMDNIYATSPHYIRCLKPNDLNEPDNFHRTRVTEQLRYGGVLEAVRVARSGFPVRMIHAEFFSRYHVLVANETLKTFGGDPESSRQFVKNILSFVEGCHELVYSATTRQKIYYSFCKEIKIPQASVQVGSTKVFLRKLSYDGLEAMRFKKLIISAVIIQSIFKCFVFRKRYLKIFAAARMLQRICRGFFGRNRARIVKFTKAATTIQSLVRMLRSKAVLKTTRTRIIIVQNLWRVRQSKQRFLQLRSYRAALSIQTAWRMHFHQHRFSMLIRAVVAVQLAHRRMTAKAILRKFRLEARDLGILQQSNDLLKKEIELLKSTAAEKTRVLKQQEEADHVDLLKSKDKEIQELTLKLRSLEHKNLTQESNNIMISQTESKKSCDNCHFLLQKIQHLEGQLAMQLINRKKDFENDTQRKEEATLKVILEEEVSRLRKLSIEQKMLIDKLQSRTEECSSESRHFPLENNQTLQVSSRLVNHNPGLDQEILSESDSVCEAPGIDMTVKTAEVRIESLKNELRQGVSVQLWEVPKYVQIDVNFKIDVTGKSILFVNRSPRKTFSFFQSHGDIPSLLVCDIQQVMCGSNLKLDRVDDSNVITIIAKNRKLTVRLRSRDERDAFYGKLRAIIAAETLSNSESVGLLTSRSGALVDPTGKHRATRRLTVRDAILEENLSTVTTGKHVGVDINRSRDDATYNVKELLQKIRTDQKIVENLRKQLLVINNELVEKNDLIVKAKKIEADFEKRMQEKENASKQDLMIRLQLGKRLEEVLLDKEEALEELEQLKIQLDNIKSSVH